MVKDEKCDLVADSHSILARWRNHFSQLLIIHEVNDVRQTELHTAEPQVPEPSTSEAELAIEKLKRHNHQVLTKSQQNWLRQGVGQFALRSINWLLLFGIRRNCLRSGRNRSLYPYIRRAIKHFIKGHITFANYVQNFFQHPAVKINSICRGNYWGSSMWISTQQVNYWSYNLHWSNTWEKMGIQWRSASAVYRLQESLWFS